MPIWSKPISLDPTPTPATPWVPTLDSSANDDPSQYGYVAGPISISAASQIPLVNAVGPGSATASWNPIGGADAVAPFAFGNSRTPVAATATSPDSSYDTVTVKTTGATFNLEFVLADNPTANFEADIEKAAGLLSTAIQNQITVNLTIGYGEVGGESLTDGSAAAGPDSGIEVSYASLRSDLIASAPSGDTNFNALPTGSTIDGQSEVEVWNAEAKALGLISANDATTDDGEAGFATDISDASMVGVALHEMTHAMGRSPGDFPDVMELFRFSSAGVNVFSGAVPGPASYFSVDGGNTILAEYGQDSDPSDFANPDYGTPTSNLTPDDPFNQYYDNGTDQYLTQVDLTQLNVLGFNTFGASSDTTSPSEVHDGPVAVTAGKTVVISASALEFDDNVSTHAEETYKIVTGPTDGSLLKSGAATTTFTQADIDNGLISYDETASGASSDSFTFTVTDAAGNATATQTSSITISPATPPSLVHDGPLGVADGSTVVISSSELEFDDIVSTHAEETYTIVTAPADGTLLKSGVATTTFTQADVDNGLISYEETAKGATSDTFTFAVTDAAGNTTAEEHFTIAVTPETAAFYDFNGDGKADMLFKTNSGEVELWDSNPSGAYTAVDVGPAPASSKILDVGDFDGDGKADILWKDTASGALTEWLSDGSGGFTDVEIGTAPAGSHLAGVGDFNGDGDADILWRGANGVLTSWNSNGSGGFTDETLGTAPAGLQIAGVGDFNDDGDADMLFRSAGGAVKLWESNGSGGFTHDTLGTLATNWAIAGIGDFNDDGDADILFRNANGGVKMWESNGSGGFTHASLGTLSTNWQVAGVGDFNGDGSADILWSNANGALKLWDSNGSGGFTHVSPGTVTAGWIIQGG